MSTVCSPRKVTTRFNLTESLQNSITPSAVRDPFPPRDSSQKPGGELTEKFALAFTSFKRQAAANVPVPDDNPGIPNSADYLKTFDEWNPFRDSNLIDGIWRGSNAAAWANQRRLVTALLGGKEAYPVFDEVLAFYKTQNPGFDYKDMTGDHGPGTFAHDSGMHLQQGLEYLAKHGGPDGVKPVAFAKLNARDPKVIKEAIAVFGSVWLHIRMQFGNRDQFQRSETWTLGDAKWSHKEDILFHNGEAAIAGGYTPNTTKIAIWGDTAEFTDDFYAAGKIWEAPIQQALNEHCIPTLSKEVELRVSDFGQDAELMGAAALVMENFGKPAVHNGADS